MFGMQNRPWLWQCAGTARVCAAGQCGGICVDLCIVRFVSSAVPVNVV